MRSASSTRLVDLTSGHGHGGMSSKHTVSVRPSDTTNELDIVRSHQSRTARIVLEALDLANSGFAPLDLDRESEACGSNGEENSGDEAKRETHVARKEEVIRAP